MEDQKSDVLYNVEIQAGYYRMGLTCSEAFLAAQPGQFVMFKPGDSQKTLLRRPFSIHRRVDSKDQTVIIELLYKVVGETTQLMAQLGKGDSVNILGPLGRGFDLPRTLGRVFIAAGGIGVAPLVFLASQLHRLREDPLEIKVFLGGRSKADLLCGPDFVHLNMNVVTTTDDGSEGRHCLVTDPLELAVQKKRPDMIYSCGPPAMLDCVIGIAEKHGVPCQVSIETMMACGIGACLGCAVESRLDEENYLHACMNGPVFLASEIQIPRQF